MIPRETLTFDAGWLARGWLSVAEASSKDKGRPALNRTVCVEFYDDGVRLVATDSYMLLTTWVPCFEKTSDAETPDYTPAPIGELPNATVVAIDEDGRAKGLFAYLLSLTNAEGAPEILVTLVTGSSPETSLGMFDGMTGDCLTIAADDREALLLDLYDGDYPTWRPLVGQFRQAMTTTLALNPDIIGRVVKMAKASAALSLDWHFGGPDRVAKVEVVGRPNITGLVMPMRWIGKDEVGVNPPVEDDDAARS